MIGAIVGDIAGSRFEFDNHKSKDFELFVSGKGKHSYLPEDWRDYFGTPVEEHDRAYKIDLADGYITTDKV